MKNSAYQASGSRFLMTGVALLIVAGTVATAQFNPFKARKRAQMMQSMNSGRSIKLMLDSFAMDNDGVYPSAETAPFDDLPNAGKWSNDLFRQLFASGNTNSEGIFWVKGAKVCTPKAPDDLITEERGRFDPKETLKAGDCGWAYIRGQANTDNPVRPILIDAYKPGTKDFDEKLWDGKVMVVRIDGSAMAMPLDAKGVLLEKGEDILSAKSAMWVKSGKDPAKLLVQPEPVKAAKAKAAPPEKEGAAKE